VGGYSLYRILGSLAVDNGEDLFDVFDAHSQELQDIYCAVGPARPFRRSPRPALRSRALSARPRARS
jgi:hypothetical protein